MNQNGGSGCRNLNPHHFVLWRICKRLLHGLARLLPGARSVRVWLHRLRGVKIGKRVFIGDQAYIENEYPECVEIQDGAEISIGAIIVAHTKGIGRVVIGRNAFIGINSVVICGGGRVLTIGEGAVIGPGAVITKSVPPGMFVVAPSPQPLARVTVPLPSAKTMEAFWAGLHPLGGPETGRHPLESSPEEK
jgi:tetrahydrodipicolinate N-succinyltransferase